MVSTIFLFLAAGLAAGLLGRTAGAETLVDTVRPGLEAAGPGLFTVWTVLAVLDCSMKL